jgi:hypothetical protein
MAMQIVPPSPEHIADLLNKTFVETKMMNKDYVNWYDVERKILKSFQLLSQYMIYSLNHLNHKNTILQQNANDQLSYNQRADEILKKQV